MPVDLSWLNAAFPDLSAIAPLNAGGQKQVFSAVHPLYGDVVLKLINPGQEPERVQREILTTKTLIAPGMPKMFLEGTVPSQTGDLAWLIEERLVGDNLRSIITCGPLSAMGALRMARDVLKVLSVAEQANIVHRDVKPENIIFQPSSDTFHLIDFGYARHLDMSSITPTAQQYGCGTLGYSPPEQLNNEKADIDSRADLFPLGVTIYECCTGFNPFRKGAVSQLEIMNRVRNLPFPSLNVAAAEAKSFADLISAMTQKRRDHRPATVAAALEWIEEICAANQI